MTQEDKRIKLDRMLYTNDSRSSTLAILAIVFNALYFVAVYQTDVDRFYYVWQIGASIIYNLVFMLVTFLCSQGVLSRNVRYVPAMIIVGVLQICRIFYLPKMFHDLVYTVGEQELRAMTDGKYTFCVVMLALSAACLLLGAMNSYVNCTKLESYKKSLKKETA